MGLGLSTMHGARELCPFGLHVPCPPLLSFPRVRHPALRASNMVGCLHVYAAHSVALRCIRRCSLAPFAGTGAHCLWRIQCIRRCSLALARVWSSISVSYWFSCWLSLGAAFGPQRMTNDTITAPCWASLGLVGCFSPSVLCAAHGSPCALGTPLGPTHRCRGGRQRHKHGAQCIVMQA